MRRVLSHVGLVISLAATGCGADPDIDTAPEVVQQTADALESAVYESSIVLAVTRAVDATTSATPLVDAIARARLQLTETFSAECTTFDRAGTSLTVTLRGCNSRFGPRNVTGQVVYSFALAPEGLRINTRLVEGTTLRIGGVRVLSLDTTVRLRGDRTTYATTIEQSAYTAIGVHGQRVTREVGLGPDATPVTATWNTASRCFTFDGAWSTRVGPTFTTGRTTRVQVTGYRVCAPERCPQLADDAVVITQEASGGGVAREARVSFLGGSLATWRSVNPTGAGTFSLSCQN